MGFTVVLVRVHQLTFYFLHFAHVSNVHDLSHLAQFLLNAGFQFSVGQFVLFDLELVREQANLGDFTQKTQGF